MSTLSAVHEIEPSTANITSQESMDGAFPTQIISDTIPDTVHSTIQAMANATLTDEKTAQITAVVMESLRAQNSILVKSIVEGVLFGLRDQISSLESERKKLVC